MPVSVAENSTEIVDLLLEDINSGNKGDISRNSLSASETASKKKVSWSDTNQVAAMSITYEAIE